MKRRVNRKTYNRFRKMYRNVALILGLVLLSFFYVWQNVQSMQLGYEIRSLEKRLAVLQEHNRSLLMELSFEKMPHRVLAKVNEKGLDLSLPRSWRMVKVKLDPMLYADDFMTLDWDASSLNMNPIIRVSKKSESLK